MKKKCTEDFKKEIEIEIYKFELKNIREDIESILFDKAKKIPQDQTFEKLELEWKEQFSIT